MNLQENIRRIQEMMGVIKEEVDDACKLKHVDPITLEKYWEDKSKTEQEKIMEVENFVKPFFTQARTYMLKYIDSEWFNKKLIEFTNGDWGDKQKKELKDFINNVNLVFNSDHIICQPKVGGFVNEDKYSNVNFCTKNIFPNGVNKNEGILVLVHEFDHCISFYFKNIGVSNYLPPNTDSKWYRERYSKESDEDYGKSNREHSARIKTLKRLLNVTDFGTLNNFIKLIKDNVKFSGQDDKVVIDKVEYDGNLIKIYGKNDKKSDKRLKWIDVRININNIDAIDVWWLFNEFAEDPEMVNKYDFYRKKSEMTTSDATSVGHYMIDLNLSLLKINLKEIYDYSIQFAKINTNNDVNYA